MAEIDDPTVMSEFLNGGFEGKSGQNLILCEDLLKIGSDCNGIVVHDSAEVIVKDAKNDDGADSSNVLVNGGADTFIVSDDPVGSDPPAADCVIVALESEEVVSELNVNSPSEEKPVEVNDLSVGEEEDDDSCTENGCNFEESTIFSSNYDFNIEGLQGEPNGDELEGSKSSAENLIPCGDQIERNDTVKEENKIQSVAEVLNGNEAERSEMIENQNKIELAAEVEDNHESVVVSMETVELKLHKLDDEENVKLQNNIELVAEVEKNRESQAMVTEGVQSDSQQLDNGEEKFVDRNKSESPENAEYQTMVVKSIESNLHQFTNGEEEVEEKIQIESASEIEKNQKPHLTVMKYGESKLDHLDNGDKQEIAKVVDEIPVEEPLGGLGPELEVEVETHGGSVNSTPFESEARNGSDESKERLHACPVEVIASETEVVKDSSKAHQIVLEFGSINWSVIKAKSSPINAVNDTRAETLRNSFVGRVEDMPSSPVSASKSEVEPPSDEVESELNISFGSYASVSTVPTCPMDDVDTESEVVNGSLENGKNFLNCLVNDLEKESDVANASAESGSGSPTFSVSVVGLESEIGDISAVPDANGMIFESEVHNGFVENGVCAPNCVNYAIDVDNEGDHNISGATGSKRTPHDIEGNERIQKEENLSPSPEGSTADALDGQKVDGDLEERSFRYLIRVPRYVDDKISEKIRLAQLQVEERTQSRDAVRVTIQLNRATCSECRDKFEASKSEERAVRDSLNTKRREMDFFQSLITRMKNANSIEDIGERIHKLEHMIEHETMPLKEEKLLMKEIKQLKHQREQLSSIVGKQAELQQVLDQRDRIEERFKLLKQEIDSLRNEVLRIEGITKAAKKKYYDENDKLKELQVKFKAADNFRQEAYMHFYNLRKELNEKNKYFWMYKDKARMANDYASARDKQALQCLCIDQVETIMELWNKNDEFRKEYVRCNIMSTLRRFRTMDGRSLGPDEEPPALPKFVDERVANTLLSSAKINSTLPVSTSGQEKSPVFVGPEKSEAESVEGSQKKSIAISQKVSKITLENHSSKFSSREDTDKEADVLKRKKEEEIARKEEELARKEVELARKEEELRKEEAAAKLKEQHRLEEKAKAKAAEERKRLKAEKAQAKAELRAQKEAELKEKEREKKAKKKERKMTGVAEASMHTISEGESAPPKLENTTLENSREPDVKEKSTTITKRSKKPSPLAKQTRTMPLPPPLRNRGKRKMQSWMWVLLMALFILAIFLVGNSGFSFKFGLPCFGF